MADTILFDYVDTHGQYPECLRLKKTEDGAIKMLVRSPQRAPNAELDPSTAGNSGCVTLPAVTIQRLIVALAESLPKKLAAPEPKELA